MIEKPALYMDCPQQCIVPEGLRVGFVPPPRHAWSDVFACPNDGCGHFIMVIEDERPGEADPTTARRVEETEIRASGLWEAGDTPSRQDKAMTTADSNPQDDAPTGAEPQPVHEDHLGVLLAHLAAVDARRHAEAAQEARAAVAAARAAIVQRADQRWDQILGAEYGTDESLTPDWTAYRSPGGTAPDLAVAYLGRGLWLVHSQGQHGVDTLTVVAPCACGRYYEGGLHSGHNMAVDVGIALGAQDHCVHTACAICAARPPAAGRLICAPCRQNVSDDLGAVEAWGAPTSASS